MTTYTRPQMEHRLGFTYICIRLEKVLNIARNRIWRLVLILLYTMSTTKILKMTIISVMGFRTKKLNVITVKRAPKADANRLLGNICRYATEGAGSTTKWRN